MSRGRGWDPEGLPEGGTTKAAGGLFEGFLRDGAVNGAVLLSLITVVAGFVSQDTMSTVLGLVVGVPGIVLPWLSVGRRWSIATVWAIVLAVIAADLAALVVMWTTT